MGLRVYKVSGAQFEWCIPRRLRAGVPMQRARCFCAVWSGMKWRKSWPRPCTSFARYVYEKGGTPQFRSPNSRIPLQQDSLCETPRRYPDLRKPPYRFLRGPRTLIVSETASCEAGKGTPGVSLVATPSGDTPALKPKTQNPKPPKPSSPKTPKIAKPETLNPKPKTRNRQTWNPKL